MYEMSENYYNEDMYGYTRFTDGTIVACSEKVFQVIDPNGLVTHSTYKCLPNTPLADFMSEVSPGEEPPVNRRQWQDFVQRINSYRVGQTVPPECLIIPDDDGRSNEWADEDDDC